MARKRKPNPVVELAEIRTARTLAAAQRLVLPACCEALGAEDLSRQVAEQLTSLPQDERSLLRRNILVAVHDLEGLVDALQAQMNGLAQELRTVSSHTSAATAYGRTARATPSNRS